MKVLIKTPLPRFANELWDILKLFWPVDAFAVEATAPQSAEDAAQWRDLVEACPWDECDSARPTGADRFAWSVRATLPDASRHADLTEDQASGPWRTLIDAVREAAAG